MPSEAHRLGRRPGGVHIVTFSGAHGVGKSTLIRDLVADNTGRPMMIIPSVSTQWFREYQLWAGGQGKEVPQTYDDINRLGLRRRMQEELPRYLANSITRETHQTHDEDIVILVDRWFGDIGAYSTLEFAESSDTLASINNNSRKVHGELLIKLGNLGLTRAVHLTHVFVPASSCSHLIPVGDATGKVLRGTQPVDAWEAAYACANVFTPAERTFVVTASDRRDRVDQVAGAIV